MDTIKVKDGFLGQKMVVLPESIKKDFHQNKICSSFFVTDLGFYPNAHNHYRTRKKGAKELIFIYCIEGNGDMIVGKSKLKITPNSYHIIPKNEPHEYRSDTNNPWSVYWMHFNGKATEQLYQRYLEQRNTDGSVSYESHRIELFNKIFNMYKSEYTVPKLEFANILALQFISSFIYSSKEIAAESTLHTNLINSIIDFLNDNLDKTFKADEIAEQFKCSPSYLFNLFKKRTGYSIIHFFNLKKIQKACEYLKYTELSIKQISYKIGIQDPLYFSRTFKKHFGFSPKDYRKEQRD